MYNEHFELRFEIDSIRDSGLGFAKFNGRSSRNIEFSISKSSKKFFIEYENANFPLPVTVAILEPNLVFNLDIKLLSKTILSRSINALSENIGRLLAAQDVNKMTDKEFREEMKILHTRIGDLQDKMNTMIDKTETRMNTDINLIYNKLESLERWRWITIGAATFVAWLLTHVVPKYVN